ncbi:transglycosylase domain-containing protein [Arthrobacter sp. EpRS71]|uniref:transglycosylase domain-containing protein n=1 Tax=Arthrobacter sp. EpRS71 TaxID=1743141 RepID=UPI000747334B|nr:transglycosylase domain-containing protein [Arthrobacter sp. EpRS71]KUM39004.1 transglycosylase [Arthrobacter sp. EpRS71]
MTLLSLVVVSELAAVSFLWFTPPRTSYMLQDGEPITYQFVSLKHISRYAIAATIAHEDQQLGTRVGAFPVDDFQKRVEAYIKGETDPSGSTIPQQLVKNIFLWPDQNGLRKGLEAVLATEFALTLPPERLVELYLNYAQFGPNLYGVCAASWYYFKTPPWSMTQFQAAALMGVVPFPSIAKRAPEGGIYIDRAVNPKSWDALNGAANVWVPKQIEGMGGWKAAVETIGITDLASDYQAERDANPDDPNSCSTWPISVVQRYDREHISR